MHANETANHISAITFAKQNFVPGADPYADSARVVPTDETSTISASLAFRSIGYKSHALPGLASLGVPFDDKLGIIPNDPTGRIIASSSGAAAPDRVPGLYCAGWVKRGPTGVIASTMADAFETADAIAADWDSGRPFLNPGVDSARNSTGLGWDGVKDAIAKTGARPVGWKDWLHIDAVEREKGKAMGKEREKFTSVEEMLKVLDG